MAGTCRVLPSAAVIAFLTACTLTEGPQDRLREAGVYIQANVDAEYQAVYDCLLTQLPSTWRYAALHADKGYATLASVNGADPSTSYYWMKFTVQDSGESRTRVNGLLTRNTYAMRWEGREEISVDACIDPAKWRLVELSQLNR